jgi:hypothetical protein
MLGRRSHRRTNARRSFNIDDAIFIIEENKNPTFTRKFIHRLDSPLLVTLVRSARGEELMVEAAAVALRS